MSSCRYCWEQFVEIVEIEPVSHEDGSGHWECPRCEQVCGVWLNGGTLDLSKATALRVWPWLALGAMLASAVAIVGFALYWMYPVFFTAAALVAVGLNRDRRRRV